MPRLLILLVLTLFAISAAAFICPPNYKPPQACTRMMYFGCVCYKNGRCEFRDYHPCSICLNRDVHSVNEDTSRCKPAGTKTPSLEDTQDDDVQELLEYLAD